MTRLLAWALAFVAMAASATVTPLPGVTPQRALAGDVFPIPIAVRVTDASGMPVEGIEVHWSGGFNGLSMDVMPNSIGCFPDLGWNCKRPTGADGIVQLPGIFAPVAGTFRLFISAYLGSRDLGYTYIDLTADPRVTAASLIPFSGSGQRAVINSAYAAPFAVRLLSASGHPIASAQIVFRVSTPLYGAKGTFEHRQFEDPYSSAATTDANGYAASRVFTAGWGLGTGTVTAEYFDSDAKVIVRAPFDFTNTNIDGSTFTSFQDLWWGGVTENGWGVAVVQHDRRLFNAILAYDAAGDPRWYVQPDGAWDEGLGSTFGGMIFSPRSAPYFDYDSSRFDLGQIRGAARLSFNGPDSGVLRTCITSHSCVDKPIERLDFSSGVPVPLQGIGDLWWGGPGQDGFGIAIMEQPGGLFPIWLTYDETGMPIWFPLEDGRWSDSTTYSGTIYRTQGSPWPQDYDATRFRERAAGTFTFRFTDLDHATFEYSLDGHVGTLRLIRLEF